MICYRIAMECTRACPKIISAALRKGEWNGKINARNTYGTAKRVFCIWSHIAREGADGGFEQIGKGLAKTGADPLQSAAYGSWKEQDGDDV